VIPLHALVKRDGEIGIRHGAGSDAQRCHDDGVSAAAMSGWTVFYRSWLYDPLNRVLAALEFRRSSMRWILVGVDPLWSRLPA